MHKTNHFLYHGLKKKADASSRRRSRSKCRNQWNSDTFKSLAENFKELLRQLSPRLQLNGTLPFLMWRQIGQGSRIGFFTCVYIQKMDPNADSRCSKRDLLGTKKGITKGAVGTENHSLWREISSPNSHRWKNVPLSRPTRLVGFIPVENVATGTHTTARLDRLPPKWLGTAILEPCGGRTGCGWRLPGWRPWGECGVDLERATRPGSPGSIEAAWTSSSPTREQQPIPAAQLPRHQSYQPPWNWWSGPETPAHPWSEPTRPRSLGRTEATARDYR